MSSTISPEDLRWLQNRLADIFTTKPNPKTEGAREVILAARGGSLKPSDAPLACWILTDAGEVLTPNLKKYVESLKPVEQPAADNKLPDVKQPPVKDVVKPNVPPEQNQKSSGREPGESKDKTETEDVTAKHGDDETAFTPQMIHERQKTAAYILRLKTEGKLSDSELTEFADILDRVETQGDLLNKGDWEKANRLSAAHVLETPPDEDTSAHLEDDELIRAAENSAQFKHELIEKAMKLRDDALIDPSLPHTDANARLLAELQEIDSATYESIISLWKAAKQIRIKPLEQKIKKAVKSWRDEWSKMDADRRWSYRHGGGSPPPGGEDDPDKIPPAKIVMDAINDRGFELWHTPDGQGYVTVDGKHIAIGTGEFNAYIVTLYNDDTGDVLSASVLRNVAMTLDGQALLRGPEHELHTRIVRRGDVIYLDMADSKNSVIEITKDGWTVTTANDIRFRRPKGMKPLPIPVRGGTLEQVLAVINIDQAQWILVKGWLIGMLNPDGSYAVLVLNSPSGRLKSKTCARLKKIVDPSFTELEELGKEAKGEEELIIAANDSHVIGLDNVSHLTADQSDKICKLSSGIGIRMRKFYTNMESILLMLRKAMIINGINEFVVRGDLLDRCIFIESPVLTTFKSSKDADKEFDDMHPKLLGALLDLAVNGLKARAEQRMPSESTTRMSDFAIWVEMCLGKEEAKKFMKEYAQNKQEQTNMVGEGNLFIEKLAALMKKPEYKEKWEGTAEDLRIDVDKEMGFGSLDYLAKKPHNWPKNARGVSSALNRLPNEITAAGLIVERYRENGDKMIRIKHIPGFVEKTKRKQQKKSQTDALTQPIGGFR